MQTRGEKYLYSKSVSHFFERHKGQIFLIVQKNNMNTIEEQFLKMYCLDKNIFGMQLKDTLMRRVVADELIVKLFSGPTSIYTFQRIEDFLVFFENKYVKEKLVPLAVYWESKYYLYNYFMGWLRGHPTVLKLEKSQHVSFLIKKLINVNIQFLRTFYFFKLLQTLTFTYRK